MPATLEVVDSHTEGEPTRVVIGGWPQLASLSMAERRDELRETYDHLRQAVVLEPRGHSAVVGALLTPAVESGSEAGVIFFNNVGYLGMCGHGLIGVVRTLEHLGRIGPGRLTIDTPVGAVGAELAVDGSVTIENVPCHAHALDVELEVDGLGKVVGDVAWGGNWFFLTRLPDEPLELANLDRLLALTQSIRRATDAAGLVPTGEGEIDHIEIFSRPTRPDADSRNFVLCPGGEYDRSPCGTGTSAKLAVLHARGELELDEPWHQESITGSLFTGWLSREGDRLIPHIRGRAFVTAHSTLHFHPDDPFRRGFATP
ncbi:MAG: proline racemase family protein [Thermoanaerobaculia bacterium]